jgi:hypothetical protein
MSGSDASQIHQLPLVIPLAVGATAIVATILIHALALNASLILLRHQKRLGRTGASFWIDVVIVARALSLALVAHLVEIAFWAVLFVICEDFSTFGIAYNHSAVNYTTLGYGDMIMTPSWRLLGPLEAANGMLMFGVSTALIFALIQRLLQARFMDLKI